MILKIQVSKSISYHINLLPVEIRIIKYLFLYFSIRIKHFFFRDFGGFHIDTVDGKNLPDIDIGNFILIKHMSFEVLLPDFAEAE